MGGSPRITKTSYWDKRENLTNKPSLSFRTIEVVQYIMIKDEVALGVALEKLMREDGLYEKVLSELNDIYGDIK